MAEQTSHIGIGIGIRVRELKSGDKIATADVDPVSNALVAGMPRRGIYCPGIIVKLLAKFLAAGIMWLLCRWTRSLDSYCAEVTWRLRDEEERTFTDTA